MKTVFKFHLWACEDLAGKKMYSHSNIFEKLEKQKKNSKKLEKAISEIMNKKPY